MKGLVKIYVLIDPMTLKIRYVGRTVRSLAMRLSQHVHGAKNHRLKTHKDDWIRSLLRLNSRPYIRLLKVVEGWVESYVEEQAIISRYKDRLLNHDDRGPGLMRNLSNASKEKISKSLKKFYEKGYNSARKRVYVYNEDGTFYREYISIRIAAESLGIYFKTISRHLNGKIGLPTKDGRKNYLRRGKQFSLIRVERMRNFKEEKLATRKRNLTKKSSKIGEL